MKIALLQEERYLPSYHGSNKSNRHLLEGLAKRGHKCLALCTVLPCKADPGMLHSNMMQRGIEVHEESPGLYSYCHRGVHVYGMPRCANLQERSVFLISRLRDFDPDVVLVSSSGHSYLVAAALEVAPDRVVYLAHGHHDLPFGPLAEEVDPNRTQLLQNARAVIVMSQYEKDYLRLYAGMEGIHLRFPVYGNGPFPALGDFNRGYVTLINSSVSKGVDLFMELAEKFPQQEFAALRWAASTDTLHALNKAANIEVWEPEDDIENILRRTKVLMMPSIVPETFGLISPEAMLHGIPVLASNLGGLPEAKLGTDHLLPVHPAGFIHGEYVYPPQDLTPWCEALGQLLFDKAAYERCSAQSRAAASHFVASVGIEPFEDLFCKIASPSSSERSSNTQTVAVVDPFDAGYLLAHELHREGYRCVSVISNEYIDDEIRAKCERNGFLAAIQHHDDVQQTVSKLQDYGVEHILPGCETGVMVADSLSEAMGCLSNGSARSAARRNKFLMAEAARRQGVAVPAQHYSNHLPDLLAWARQWSKWPVVVKPPQSLASDDVSLCRSEADIELAFREIVGRRNIAGVMNNGLIVQELMDATQYVVDTVSYEGRHYLSGIWRYGRPEFASDVLRALAGNGSWPASVHHLNWEALTYGAISSVSKEILPGTGDMAEALFSYATQVLDALEINYGPAHFELMCTPEGIRLVEVGARVHGAPQTHIVNQMCTGSNQVAQTIDLYLNPARFLSNARRSYSLRWHAMMVRLTPWICGVLKGFRGLERIKQLASFHDTFVMAEPGRRIPGCVGVVILLHPDEHVMRQDCQTIRRLEKEDLYEVGELAEAAKRN